jgi:dipeptidase D
MAATMAILEDKSLKHGALEGLFTVDEETGLTGAFQLKSDFLIGRTMLNLDSEEEGSIYVGCAGGGDSMISLPIQTAPVPAEAIALMVKVSGLRGGHSGVDIHEQRGNAIKLLGRILTKTSRDIDFQLFEVSGGSKRNAIPRETWAKVVLNPNDTEGFKTSLHTEEANILGEIKPIDPNFRIEVEEITPPGNVLHKGSQHALLNLLNGLPHGVQTMNFDIPDLVETSTNLATITTNENKIVIGMSTRSSMGSALQAVRDSIHSIGTLAGAKVEEKAPYPGWKPNMDSQILKVTKEIFKESLGKDPEIKAIHAGLECGIIGEKFKGMDMISIGPDIKYPHSPEEKVHIESVRRFYELILKILERIN